MQRTENVALKDGCISIDNHMPELAHITVT